MFFFQAEDGIRYIGVTGVQTCALPIYEPDPQLTARREDLRLDVARPQRVLGLQRGDRVRVVRAAQRLGARLAQAEVADLRSEERRVGKECRSRWSPYH